MTRLIMSHCRCQPCRDSSVTYVMNSDTLSSTQAWTPLTCGELDFVGLPVNYGPRQMS